MRRQVWWLAPFASSVLASIVDTFVFFAGAFAFTPVPWVTLALGDLAAKLLMALVALGPYRVFIAVVRRETQSWRHPLIMLGYLFAMAWLAAFATYHTAVWLGAG